MTSMVKFADEIAREVHGWIMNTDVALADYGHIISRDDLDDALGLEDSSC